MSVARSDLLRSIEGLRDALALESLAQGATATTLPPGAQVLRRGILVASLIALEAFVRERTAEALQTLERWPKSYPDLPEKLRVASRLDALSYLQTFARLLRRQEDDFESELKLELSKMVSGEGTVQRFSKFVAGDFTGNISEKSLAHLLSALQVKDCWTSFRRYAAVIGLGVPSVQEVVKGIVRKRHRSAHAAGYTPSATEVSGLAQDLVCIAICFDVAVSVSMEQALAQPDAWSRGDLNWEDDVVTYIAEPVPRGFRVLEVGKQRAIHIRPSLDDIRPRLPRPKAGELAVLIEHDQARRPVGWFIL